MFMEERQQQIAETINNEGRVSITAITEKYNISDESARRDLRMLEQKGLCKRTHGGAIKCQQISVRLPDNRDFSKITVLDTYKYIAKEAAGLIKENDTVYLTGGSMGYIMLSYLPTDIFYTVVVNSVDIAKELRGFENIDVYIVGGKMRKSGLLVDSLANEFVSRMHFDICFISCAGASADFGVSNGTDETASFQRSVIKNSIKRVLLVPGEKVGKDSFIKVCEIDEFSTVITDWDCLEEQIADIEKKGIQVAVAEK